MHSQKLVTGFLSKAKNPLIVILGATASGKTRLSIEIAKQIEGAEVVNADSRQLYRYLDIGTAKITEQEMAGIPHHLIDVLDPNEEATAGWYQLEAKRVIDELHNQAKVPLLVGGSMLYLSTIIDDLTMAQGTDANVRERLLQEYEKDNGVTLYARLKEIDPEAADRIHPNNMPRLVRAVEIYEQTEKSRSQSFAEDEMRIYGDHSTYDLLILGVRRSREDLHQRINQRAVQMFAGGWIEEVQGLLEKGYTTMDPGMKSHGYREIIQYLDEGTPASLEELTEMIAAKSRQYARRQETWWRNDPRIQWLSW